MNTQFVKQLFAQWHEIFLDAVDSLTELDAVGGDGDLGVVMRDGFQMVDDFVKTSEETDIGKLFYQAGKKFNSIASSSMGTLLASGFMTIGKTLKGKRDLDDQDISVLFEGMAQGVAKLGGAKEGEKTFLDAIYPAQRAYAKTINQGIDKAVEAATQAAHEGVQSAKQMQAQHGRLAFRGEQSIGIVDPGSVAAYYYVQGIQRAVQHEAL